MTRRETTPVHTSSPQVDHGRAGRLLLTATTAQASASVTMQGLPALAAFIQVALGLSATQTGSLTTAAGTASIFSLIMAGRLLDRSPERVVMLIGAGVMAAGAVGAAAVPTYVPLLLCLLIVGAGYSTAQVGGNKTIVDAFGGSRLGWAIGVRQAGLPAGGALGAAALPAVAARWGWQSAMLAAGLSVLVGAGLFWWMRGRTERAEPHRESSPRPDPGRGPATGGLRAVLASVRETARRRSLRRPLVVGFALMAGQTGVLVFLMPALRESVGLSLQAGAGLLVLALLAGAIGRVILAGWADSRFGTCGGVLVLATCALAGSVLGIAALPADAPVALVVAVVAWTGFFGFGWFGPWILWLVRCAPADQLGQTLGVAMAWVQMAIVATPLALGLIRDAAHSYHMVWLVLSVLLISAATLCPLMQRRQRSHP